jgi:hypothetical protein
MIAYPNVKALAFQCLLEGMARSPGADPELESHLEMLFELAEVPEHMRYLFRSPYP